MHTDGNEHLRQPVRAINDNESREVLNLHAETIGNVGGYGYLNFIDSNDIGSHISLGDISNPVELLQDDPQGS